MSREPLDRGELSFERWDIRHEEHGRIVAKYGKCVGAGRSASEAVDALSDAMEVSGDYGTKRSF